MNLNTNLNALLSAPTGPPMAPNHQNQDRGQIPGFGPTNSMNQHQQQPTNIAGGNVMQQMGGGQQPMNMQHDDHGQMGNMGQHQGPGQPQQAVQVQLNTAQYCRFGQDNVQEIVTKTQELFTLLKTMQPPNGTQPSINAQEERKNKLAEMLKVIGLLFRRLRKLYEKCLEGTAEMEYVQMESLIPLRDEQAKNPNQEDKKSSEQFRRFEDERKQYTEQLKLRNRQLKEIIDKLREVVWEINTMLAIRKP